MLFDVVGRALTQRGFVEGTASIAGHQDEGFVGAEVFRGSDDVETGAVRKTLVDEIDVVMIGLDAFQTGGRRRDHFYLPLEVRIDQRHLDQRLRLRVVVNQQNADVAEIVLSRLSSDHG